MRFPIGLRARLLRRSFLQSLRPGFPSGIFQLSPLVRHFPLGARNAAVADPESEWHSAKSCAQVAAQARAVAVWVGGTTEPLLHPNIGEVISSLTDNGHYVFLHTSGVGLRRSIHEFEPVNRLFLTVEVPLGSASPQLNAASREALRVARLSGFHCCAHFTVSEPGDTPELAASIAQLESCRLDGLVVSSGNGHSTAVLSEAAQLIPSSSWRYFSLLLQSSSPQVVERANPPQASGTPAQPGEACGESA
jgi:hypothetical protein